MNAVGYQSWFLSAQDRSSPRAIWIRHTRHRPSNGPESAALWCTVVDPVEFPQPVVVKQVFVPDQADGTAGPAEFRGKATMGGRTVSWELGVASSEKPLRPLRPQALYRAPLPRTKLEATVPDALISGRLEVDGRAVDVAQWRGTVGHNWGSEHADSWVWLHAADFDGKSDIWLELALARIRVGGVRSPWMAVGALSTAGQRIPLGGLGHRAEVNAGPGLLGATVACPGGRLRLTVSTTDGNAVAVPYADPSGGSRSVRHAVFSAVELRLRRRSGSDLTATTKRGAYEYGSQSGLGGLELADLPHG